MPVFSLPPLFCGKQCEDLGKTTIMVNFVYNTYTYLCAGKFASSQPLPVINADLFALLWCGFGAGNDLGENLNSST